MNRILLTLFFLTITTLTFAGNYQEVVTILNNSCANYGCHNTQSTVSGLDFSLGENEIYDQIFKATPQIQAAAEKGYKLVFPGDPAKSFLYRKINGGLHADSELGSGMGQTMPINGALNDHEIELVRQWILHGAKNDTGTDINLDILEEYYTEGGLERMEAPAPPPEGEGFQLHFGHIFLEPGEEKELVYRYELQNEEPFEINSIDVQMNNESHHFLFFKFNEGAENNQEDGILEVNTLSTFLGTASAITSDTKMIGGWAYSNAFDLPNGTAFVWEDNEVLKFNYHILNYSQTSILPAEIYVNIYTQPKGTALHEMHSEFHLYGGNNPLALTIPPGESSYEWDFDDFNEASPNDDVHIWSLGAHTHKYGTDFDVYLNTTGEQVYEGFYNVDYTANQGFYDYAEPPFRYFDAPFLTLKANDGLNVTADYNNTSDQTVSFGLTTNDEMFGMFVQYLEGDISDILTEPEDTTETSISDLKNATWSIYPNPTTGVIYLENKEQNSINEVVVFNTVGQVVFSQAMAQNDKIYKLDLSFLSDGAYWAQILNEKGEKEVQKLTITH